MKTTIRFMFVLLLIPVLFLSCHKLDTIQEPFPSDSLLTQFQAKHMVPSQFFTVNAQEQTSKTTAAGVTININPNILYDYQGNMIQGNVTLEFKEIFHKKDFILSDKPTISNGQLLVSGGVFYIQATQNGKKLKFEYSGVRLDVPATNISNTMTMFKGALNSDSQFNWNRMDSSWVMPSPPLTYIAHIRADSIPWYNIDQYFSYSQNARLEVNSSNNPSKANTIIYLVFKNQNSMYRIYPDDNYNFILANMPNGLEASIVAFTLANDKVYFVKKDITTAQNLVTNIIFQETTEANMISQLESL